MSQTFDLGKVGLRPRGAWSNAVADYEYLDVVTDSGNSYMVVKKLGTVPAGTALTDAAVYQKIAGKGEKFVYADFTPAQIADLKKPATDAAAVADTATNNANTATNAANTATTGANTAKEAANTAASGANTAKDAANTAKTNADNATTAANSAALAANNAAVTADIKPWVAQAYPANGKSTNVGRIWRAKVAALATDIPGSAPTVWEDMGSAYAGKTDVAPMLAEQFATLNDIDYTSDATLDVALGATGNTFGAAGFVTSGLRDCIPGNLLRYKGNNTGGSGTRAVIGYDAAGTFVSILLATSSDLTFKTIQVPAGIYKYRMCSGYPMAFFFGMAKYIVNRSNVNIPELPIIQASYPAVHIDRIGVLTEFDYSTDVVASTYLLANGTLQGGNSDYVTTNLRACAPGDIIKYKGQTVGSAVRAVVGYDAAGTFVSVLLAISSDLTVKSLTIPVGVYQYRECANVLSAYAFSKMEYVIARKYLNIPDLTTANSNIATLDSMLNTFYKATAISFIAMDWKNQAYIYGAYENYGFNPAPFPADQFVETIEFRSGTPLTDAINSLKIIQLNANNTVTELATITPQFSSTTRVGNIITHTLAKPIYIAKGFYLAIRAGYTNLANNDSATGIIGGWFFNGATWGFSNTNHGWAVNFYGKSVVGIKERLMSLVSDIGDTSKVQDTVIRVRNQIVPFLRFNFSQAVTDWTLNAWTVAGGIASVTTLNSMLQLKKRYVSDRRIFRAIIMFKADSVINIGACKYLGDTSPETSFVFDIPGGVLKIHQQTTTNVIASTPITIPLVVDTEYLVEIERDRHISRVRIFDPKTGAKNETSFDYGSGTNFGSGAGNHSSHYFIRLTAGSGLSVKSIGIYGQKAVYVFGGDSITDVNGRCAENWAEITGRTLGGNYGIVGKTEAQISHLIESLSNEIVFMEPKFLIVMIGTNNAPSTPASAYQPIIDFCTANKILLALNRIVASGDGGFITKNATIESLNQMGAHFDRATSLNGDPAQGGDPAKYNEPTIIGHPNQLGNTDMAARTLVDLPILRNFI